MSVTVTDPRTKWDDLHIDSTTEQVSSSQLQDHRTQETFQSGWVTVAFVLNPHDDVLFASDGDEWFLPGGTQQSGEQLEETLIREIHEETGVKITPIRPHIVFDYRIEGPENATSFTLVGYEATTELSAAPGPRDVAAEEVAAAAFHPTVPENLYGEDLFHQLVRRIDPASWPVDSQTYQ